MKKVPTGPTLPPSAVSPPIPVGSCPALARGRAEAEGVGLDGLGRGGFRLGGFRLAARLRDAVGRDGSRPGSEEGRDAGEIGEGRCTETGRFSRWRGARRWAPREARRGRGEDGDAGGFRDAPERRTTAVRRRAGKATRAGPAAATTREAASATPRSHARATTRVAGRVTTMDDVADIVASSSRGAAATGRGRGPSRLPAAGEVSTARRRATQWRGVRALAPPRPSRC